MKREVHKAVVRAKILGVARKLFLQNGYGNTTIRTIAQQADVRIGSIYHFFGNKEGIFEQIAVESFHRVIKRMNALVDNPDTLLHLAAELSWHVYVMARTPEAAELYLITYNSPQVAEAILAHQITRSRQLFQSLQTLTEDSDHLAGAMLANGMMQSLALRAQMGQLADPTLLLNKSLTLLFRAVGFPIEQIEGVLTQVSTLDLPTHVAKAMKNDGMLNAEKMSKSI